MNKQKVLLHLRRKFGTTYSFGARDLLNRTQQSPFRLSAKTAGWQPSLNFVSSLYLPKESKGLKEKQSKSSSKRLLVKNPSNRSELRGK